MGQIRLNIDGRECLAYDGQSLVQVAAENGIHIPTLCHDERVKAYGSCGVCVVEREGFPKLLRACSTMAEDGMVIYTNTDKVNNTRRTALELLLSDHEGDCRPPCVLACPGQTDCQGYVGLIANGEYEEALKLVMDVIPLPAAIGRVCPHPCEAACRRKMVEEPISIASLKRFVADKALETGGYPTPEVAPESGKSVAIIGGGPGGLTAAYFLRQKGHTVDVYDSMPHMGGMLRYGIPEYRLPKATLQEEIDHIQSLGITFHNNTRIGEDVSLQALRDTHDAVVVAVGAWTSTDLGCPGQELGGVLGGIDFLRKVVLGKPSGMGKTVAVVGGGNTAMDACRTAVRLGAKKVYCVYRRTRAEMPAEEIEIREAEEEGVEFRYLNAPIEVIDDTTGRVDGMRLQVMKLGEADASGRRAPVPVKGQVEVLEVDTVISAIGQKLNAFGLDGIDLSKRNTILADEKNFRTNLPGVFAVGDATNDGASIAIAAIGDARKAAAVIDDYLHGEDIPYTAPYLVTSDPKPIQFAEIPKAERPQMAHCSADIRRGNFEEFAYGFTEEQAQADAARCLECGCKDYFECKLIHYANDYKVKPEKFDGLTHHRPVENEHPFIVRNPDKCILCGLCVRICDEVVGAAALGLVDRGFDTIVKPALDLPLAASGCISCGQCVDACPTGALLETMPIRKQVPIEEEETITTCSFCSLGCEMKLTHKGSTLLRALPHSEAPAQDALLCMKGRFGFGELARQERITAPRMRKPDGALAEVTYDEAYAEIAEQMKALRDLHGAESIGVAVSDRLSSEEILLIQQLAESALHTTNVFSFNRPESGLASVLGADQATAGLDELHTTQLILLVESNIERPHLIAGLNIRKGVSRGAKLIAINSFPSAADEIAAITANPGADLELLRGILKEAIALSPNAASIAGYDDLVASLADVTPSDEAKAIAKAYVGAKTAITVFEEHMLSPDAAALLADLALVAGHASGPRKGILRLKANNNSQGLADLGIQSAANIDLDALRGLLIFGEDVPELPKLSFLAVQEVHMTETAKRADIVLPAASFAETNGLYTNTAGSVKTVRAALPSLIGRTNAAQLLALAQAAGHPLPYRDSEDARRELVRFRRPAPAGEICLQPIAPGALTAPRSNTNAMQNSIVAYAMSQMQPKA